MDTKDQIICSYSFNHDGLYLSPPLSPFQQFKLQSTIKTFVPELGHLVKLETEECVEILSLYVCLPFWAYLVLELG